MAGKDNLTESLVLPEALPNQVTKVTEFDRVTILALYEKGYSTHQISEHLGFSQTTVWRYVNQALDKNERLGHYKANRADYLAFQQYEETEIQAKLRAELLEDGVIAKFSPEIKRRWYETLNQSSGTKYDKERLERGESTQNISQLTTIIERATAKNIKKSPQDVVVDVDNNDTSEVQGKDNKGLGDE